MLTEQLVEALRPMIGFRSDELTASATPDDTLPAPLKTTTTGVTVDQCHDLLRLATLKAAYRQDVKDFPNYLARTRDDAIRALLTTVQTRLVEAELAPRLLPSKTLYNTVVNPPGITAQSRRVGLRLTTQQEDVTLSVDRSQIVVTGLINPITLRLTDELTGDEVGTIEHSLGGRWLPVTWPVLEAKRSYLLTYEEADLKQATAYNTFVAEPAKQGCRGCLHKCVSHFLKVDGVTVVNDLATIVPNQNFGLNLVVSAAGDVSGRLLDNPVRLLPALRHQIAATFLEKIAYSNRINGETADASENAMFALFSKENPERIPVRLDRAISALIKALAAEASKALDVDESDEVEWSTI